MSCSRKIFSGGPPNASGYYLGAAEKALPASSKPEDAVPHNYGKSYDDVKRDLLEKGDLYYDPNFPARDSSIYDINPPPFDIVWKRPNEIVDNPKLIVNDATRFDVTQGTLGDCWLLATLGSLCNDKGLLSQVMPDGQSFEDDYCGLFRFRFWQYGRWEEVIVDDRLPTYNGNLVYLHSPENTEFWSPLLEKAYAKLYGSYEALTGGHASEAMVDFTGGITESYKLRGRQPDNLFDTMVKSRKKQSLICASIEVQRNQVQAKLANGLVTGHAYTISAVEIVSTPIDYKLLKIRNPWGGDQEWNGAWCDGSSDWYKLSKEDKDRIGVAFQEDGEFWISFDDFCDHFDRVDICLLSPDAPGHASTNHWEMQLYQGTWQKNLSAGGCRNYPDTFHLNPQYSVTLDSPDEDCNKEGEEKCTVVIGLLQKSRRNGVKNVVIGLSMYKVEDNAQNYKEDGRFTKDFFLNNYSVARSDTFVNSREVSSRFALPVGEYVVIPSTFDPDEEADFILRMFSEQPHNTECMDTPTQIEIKTTEPTEEEDSTFDEEYKECFEQAAGDDGEVDPFELQGVISSILKTEGRNFTIDACRSMLSMVDLDRNGKLSYDEFRQLWRTVLEWEENFNACIKNIDGDLYVWELRGALSHLGFQLNTPSLSSIALRWSTRSGGISLEDYIQICCRVKTAFDSFLAYEGKTFSLNNYIMQALYI